MLVYQRVVAMFCHFCHVLLENCLRVCMIACHLHSHLSVGAELETDFQGISVSPDVGGRGVGP